MIFQLYLLELENWQRKNHKNDFKEKKMILNEISSLQTNSKSSK